MSKKELRRQRKIALQEVEDELIDFEDDGNEVDRFTDYHWRVNNKIDLWPSSRKYMKNGIVKTYKKSLFEILN